MRAGDRVVEKPGPLTVRPVHLVGALAVATPDPLVNAGRVGQGFDPLASWAISHASVTVGNMAFGCPFIGLGADPPLAMLDHLDDPPPPLMAPNDPVIVWLQTPSVWRMPFLAPPWGRVSPPVQLNSL